MKIRMIKESLNASVGKFISLILLYIRILRINILIILINIKMRRKNQRRERLRKEDLKNIEIDLWKQKSKENF
jgi:hypothetical protein